MTKYGFSKAEKKSQRLACSEPITKKRVPSVKRDMKKKFPDGRQQVVKVSGGKFSVISQRYEDWPDNSRKTKVRGKGVPTMHTTVKKRRKPSRGWL